MTARSKKALLTFTAIAALAAPGAAQARQGADDPPGHVRHGNGDDVRSSGTSATHRHRHRGRHHHRGRHGRRGAHHGANHS